MRALSIREPWATMIAQGTKTVELRSWRTRYRGPILLCASKQPDIGYAGHGFAIADLVDILDPRKVRRQDACAPVRGRYGWVLRNVTLLDTPIPVRGRLGLFYVTVRAELY